MHGMVGPKGSAARFINAYVPPDLRALPGDWHQQLPDYYGACESIDTSVGRLRKVLEEEGLAEDTIFVFFSDHGCHFMTRNEEYKRSTHNSSLRVPMLIDGPGFETGRQIPEMTAIINLAPTLLEACGGAGAGELEGAQYAAADGRPGGARGVAEQRDGADQRVDDGAHVADAGLDLLRGRRDGGAWSRRARFTRNTRCMTSGTTRTSW